MFQPFNVNEPRLVYVDERNRWIGGLSVTIIDFYVTVLTPLLHCGEASLQLSENITFFAICCICTRVIGSEA
jgi:hypothetical protein